MVRPARALLHPLWLGALVVLAANDWVFKGAGILPSVLTGKLSDFAGLLVAQVVIAVFIRTRTKRALLVGSVSLALAFASIKTSALASSLYERAFAFVSARNVVDPTDLVALVVLPLGYVVFGNAMSTIATVAEPPVPRRRLETLALLLSLPFCLATSAPDRVCAAGSMNVGGRCIAVSEKAPVVYNPGLTDITVSVRTLIEPGASPSTYAADLACTLPPEAFGPPRSITLKPGEARPLETTATSDGQHIALVSAGEGHPTALFVAREETPPLAERRVPHFGWEDTSMVGSIAAPAIGVSPFAADGQIYVDANAFVAPYLCARDLPDAHVLPDGGADASEVSDASEPGEDGGDR